MSKGIKWDYLDDEIINLFTLVENIIKWLLSGIMCNWIVFQLGFWGLYLLIFSMDYRLSKRIFYFSIYYF